ncbi:hypothetical protein I3842_04G139100 [Carya illinoinensis]|uniref:Uncharacterized protein n=1 Tax=Carya illinoinensis TaxID=32201 RepID=A0A922FCE8_CARIL|nr:hypothetical protein I3842_04G139100 [Carya illinoinensis]
MILDFSTSFMTSTTGSTLTIATFSTLKTGSMLTTRATNLILWFLLLNIFLGFNHPNVATFCTFLQLLLWNALALLAVILVMALHQTMLTEG